MGTTDTAGAIDRSIAPIPTSGAAVVAGRGVVPPRDLEHGGADLAELTRERSIQGLRLGFGRDHDGSEVGAREFQRPVAELRRLERLRREAVRFLQGESRPSPPRPAPGRGRAPRSPLVARATRGDRRPELPLARRRSIDTAARSALRDIAPHAASTVAPRTTFPIPARMTSPPANVSVDGPVSSPARVSRTTSAIRREGLSIPFVTATSEGPPSRARIVAARCTISALSPDWLTTITGVDGSRIPVRKWRSSAAPIITAVRSGLGEVGRERVARRVRTAHPREDHRVARDEAGHRSDASPLVGEPRSGSPERLGLPRDLGVERVRKVS